MRFTILFAMLLTIAQTSYAKPNSRSGFWVRPAIAGGASTLTGYNLKVNGYIFTPETKAHLSVGVDVGGMFNDHVGLFAGVHFSETQYDLRYSNYKGYVSLNGETGYVDVPLYFRFVTSQYKRLGYFMDVGFVNSFLASCKAVAESKVYTGGSNRREENDNSEKIYQSFSFAPFMYLGFNIPAGSRLDINVGPAVSYQATNLFDDMTNEDGSKLTGHYLNFAIKAAFGIRCTR